MHRVHDFPDPSICITRHFFDKYWICLANDNKTCPNMFTFGRECLCNHPENFDFSEEYKKEVNR